METSILIAKLAAVVYLGTGVALLNGNFNLQRSYKVLLSSTELTTYLGLFDMLIGTLIITYHNVWVNDWTFLITLVGWILLVEGIFYILAPKPLLGFFKKLPQSQTGWGLVTLLVGLFFGYYAFVV